MKYSSVLIHFTFLKMRAVCEILEEAVKLNTVVSSRIDIKINLVFHAQSDL